MEYSNILDHLSSLFKKKATYENEDFKDTKNEQFVIKRLFTKNSLWNSLKKQTLLKLSNVHGY